MKNLKKLLAVIVAICVLATFTVPAFAEEAAVKTDAEICADLGVLKGTTSGVDAEYLAKGTQRYQAAVITLRLAGKYEEALAYEGTENFDDAAELEWTAGRPALAYLKANPELGWAGSTSGNFFPYGEASAQMIYKVLLESLGYKQGTDFTWDGTIEFAAEKGLVKVADVAKLTNNDVAIAIVEALKAKVKDSEATLAETLVEAGAIDKAAAVAAGLYSAELKATAAATGAKKITVTFNQAVDSAKAVITAARGTVKPSIKAVTFAEDKKSAVIEFTTAMAAGDYTVSVAGLTEEALTAAVKVEAEKLVAINFLTEVAVISTNDITTNVIAVNQYDEDVSAKLAASTVTVSASKGSSPTVSNKGLVKVLGAVGEFKVDDKVVVTIVDAETGVVSTKTLTVVKAAAVESIEFGEIATDDKDLKDKEINVTAMTTNVAKYYLPIKVKDQYGNTLKKADLASGFTVMSSNSNIIKINVATPIDENDTIGTFVKFETTGGSATHGTVVITAVASVTGKTASTSILVKENAKLDVVTLSAPASELKLNTAVVLPVSVVDTYGKDVALKDITFGTGTPGEITLNTNTKITASSGTFAVSNDYVKDIAEIKLTPTAKTVVLTVTTATGKFQSLTLTANDAPAVAGIKGVKSDFATMLANDASLTTTLKDNVEFVDQYGEKIAVPDYKAAKADGAASYYTIAKDDAAATITGFTPANGVIAATTTAGTETYVVTLYDKDSKVLDTFNVAITVVDKDKITAFGIDDLKKFYTGGVSVPHGQQVKVHGLVDGNKVVVNQAMIKNVSATNGLPGLNATSGAYVAELKDTDDKDVTSTLTVLVSTSKNTYTVTKEIVYSSATPAAASISIQVDDKDVTGAVQVTPVTTNNIVTTGTDGLRIFAKDQYGVEMATGYTFVITNNDTTATIAIATGGAITITGAPTAGKSFQIFVIKDGLTANLKVIIG